MKLSCKRHLCFCIFILCMILMARSSEAKDLFISTTGNDSVTYANNDINHPWRTPYLSAAKMQAGDTLYFRAGTYNVKTPDVSGACEAPETIKAVADNCTFKPWNNEEVIVQGGDVDNGGTYGMGPSGFVFCSNGHSGLTWDGFKIKGVIGLLGNGTNNTIQNCDISQGGDNWLGNRQGEVIYIQGWSESAQTNWTIKNCKLHDNVDGDEGGTTNAPLIMVYQASYGLIENCEIYNSVGPGIRFKDTTAHSIVRYNYIHDNLYGGFHSAAQGNPHENSIYQNIFKNNGENLPRVLGDNGGGQVFFQANVASNKIYNNTFYGATHSDIKVGGAVANSTNEVFNNISVTPSIYHVDFYYNNSWAALGYLDYNLYRGTSDEDDGIMFRRRYSTGTDATLTAWKSTLSSSGIIGADTHSISTDPGFVNKSGSFSTPSDFKRSSYPTNGRGGTYSNVIGAYITGNEIIGYTEPSSQPSDTTPPATPSGLSVS